MQKIIVAILIIGALSAAFHGLGLIKILPWHIVYSDVLGFYPKAVAPGFPYLEKPIEYPVLMGLLIHFTGFIGQSPAGYYIFNSVLLIFFTALATYFLYKITPEQNRKRLWQFWIFAPSMFIFAVYNWDMLALLFVILAFYFMAKNKDGWAAFFLALGFCSKFYPIIYLPILIVKNPNWKNALKLTSIFLFSFLILNSFFMLVNFNGWSYFYTLNNLRNSNPDSIWTIVRFIFRGLDVSTINWLSLLLFGSSYLFILWKYRPSASSGQDTIKLCFLATLLFLTFNKVFSPQYLLWLLPFFVLIPQIKKSWIYTLEFSNLATFFIILPWFLISKDISYFYYATPFVALRHIALITILSKEVGLLKFTEKLKNQI